MEGRVRIGTQINIEITIVVGVTVVTVQVVITHPDVGAGSAVTQCDATNAASEAANVVEEPQTLDNHGGATTQLFHTERTLLLPANTQHTIAIAIEASWRQ